MDYVVYTVHLLLCGCNCLLHGLASFILLKLHKKNSKSSQWYCLLSLCVAELLQNICRFILYPLKLYWAIHPRRSKAVGHVIVHVALALNTGIVYQCLFGMFLITADRLLCILLDLRYRIYWNYKRTRVLVLSTWIFSFIVTLILSLRMDHIMETKRYKEARLLDTIANYILTTVSILFVIFATFSYGFIFHKYLSSRRAMLSKEVRPLSVWQAFRSSKFFTSVLLVSSFLVFWVTPTLLANITGLLRGVGVNERLKNYVNISYLASDLIDGVIYVFLRPSVQRELKKKFSTTTQVIRYGRSSRCSETEL